MKCRYPILIKDDDRKCSYYVPCGKCAWCRSRLRNEWYFRFKIERLGKTRNRFVTFTYEDDHLPFVITEYGELIPSVNPDHIDKLIRKAHNQKYKFRYFLASEYGKNTKRPHYHMLTFSDEEIPWQDLWPYGNVIDVVQNDGSLKYVTKYILKGSSVPDGAEPNFRRLSRRPGIGSSFVYKGQPYLLTADGVMPVGHYYRRRYLNSLNSKLKDMTINASVEYMKDRSQFEDFSAAYNKYGAGRTLEEFLDDLYKKDLSKQFKINSK